MAQQMGDLLVVQIRDDFLSSARVLARERVKHEYNRFGYSYSERISKIEAGLIGELVFGDFLNQQEIPALYYCVVGQYDDGYDFRAGHLKIDVKTTTFQGGSRPVQQSLGILYRKFNLYIADDPGQAQKAAANVYVQAFVIDDQWCVLAGFAKGVPDETSKNPRNIFQAKKQPIPHLEPMAALVALPAIQPTCARCGELMAPRKRQVFLRGTGKVTVTDTVPEVMADSYRKHGILLCAKCS